MAVTVAVAVVAIALLGSSSKDEETFTSPTESMLPALKPGQRFTVDRSASCCSRGDIIVFDAPPLARSNSVTELVKRVVGLPGDTLEYRDNGRVYIDGQALKETYLPKGTETTIEGNPLVPPGCGRPPDHQPGCKIPAGHVFVLGDNRPASKDSRFFGPIAQSSVIGVKE